MVIMDKATDLWHTKTMIEPLNKKKVPKDINQLAAYIVEQTTKEADNPKQPQKPKPSSAH